MNKIEVLLKQYCSQGVEYKKVSSVIDSLKTGLNPRKNFKLNEPGAECYYITGKDVYNNAINISSRTDKISFNTVSLINRRARLHNDVLLFVSTGTGTVGRMSIVEEYSGDWSVSETIYIITTNQESILTKYLMYALYSSYARNQYEPRITKGSVPHLKVMDLLSVIIPVPPISIQYEIVKILDSYSNVETELYEKLKEEVLLRRQQYEFCCDRLFDKYDCKKVSVSELAKTNIGLATSVTKHKAEKGVLLLHNSDIVPNKIVVKKTEYITEVFALKNSSKILREGDVITVHTGDVGTSAVINKEYDGAIGFTTITSRIKDLNRIIPEYYCRYLNSRRCKEEIEKMTISDRSNLNQRSFEKLMIPVPGIVEQERIVSSLEMIDKAYSQLLKDLNNEIIARQKQYDYYREKILTFKPLES